MLHHSTGCWINFPHSDCAPVVWGIQVSGWGQPECSSPDWALSQVGYSLSVFREGGDALEQVQLSGTAVGPLLCRLSFAFLVSELQFFKMVTLAERLGFESRVPPI